MEKKFHIILACLSPLATMNAFASADTLTPAREAFREQQKLSSGFHHSFQGSYSDDEFSRTTSMQSTTGKQDTDNDVVQQIIKSGDVGKINTAAYNYAEDDKVDDAVALWGTSIEIAKKDTKNGKSYLHCAQGHYGALLLNNDDVEKQTIGAALLWEAALEGERSARIFLAYKVPEFKKYFSTLRQMEMAVGEAVVHIIKARQADQENIWKLNS